MDSGSKVKAGKPGRPPWPETMRAAFLDCLSATCNVSVAAVAGGVTRQTALRWRREDSAFAEAWSEALALGYEMLETRLVGHALAGEQGDLLSGDEVLPPASIELALRLLTYHRHASGKPPARKGPKRTYADKDDSDRVILAKLAQIEARRAKAAAGGAK